MNRREITIIQRSDASSMVTFTDRGTGHPSHLEAFGDLSAGCYVILSVADQGHGMDKDTLQKAIEPFFSTKELGKGTGLGLSMIHGWPRS